MITLSLHSTLLSTDDHVQHKTHIWMSFEIIKFCERIWKKLCLLCIGIWYAYLAMDVFCWRWSDYFRKCRMFYFIPPVITTKSQMHVLDHKEDELHKKLIWILRDQFVWLYNGYNNQKWFKNEMSNTLPVQSVSGLSVTCIIPTKLFVF